MKKGWPVPLISPGLRSALSAASLLVAFALAIATIHWLLNQRLSGFPWKDFLKHAGLVIGLLSAVLAIALVGGEVARLSGLGRAASRTLAAIGLTVIALALLGLYAADYFAHVYLRSNLTATAVNEVANGIGPFARSSPLVAAAVASTGLAIGIVVAFLAWSLAGVLVRPVKGLLRPVVVVGLIAFASAGAYAWQDLVRRPGSWGSDSVGRLAIGAPRLDITLTGGTPPQAPPDAPDVIVILSDSLRADHLPQYGYHRATTPFLTQLARTGHVSTIDYATSTCPRTACGVLSVLLSNPLSLAIGRENTALHLYLRKAGYRVSFLLSGAHSEEAIEPAAIGAPTIFDTFVDPSRTRRGNDDEQVLEGLDRMAERGREPHLIFVFLMATHLSGRKLPAFRKYLPEQSVIGPLRRFNGAGIEDNPLPAAEREALANGYDNGIVQMDDYVRRIFEGLTAKGYLKNAVLFLSSDHGEALGEHGKFAHGTDLFPENLRVPLLVYDTSGRRYPAGRFASITDIAATAVARVGLPVPQSWDGIDIAGDRPREWSFSENYVSDNAPCRGVYRQTQAALYYLLDCTGVEQRLYDLTKDPLGSTNVLATVDPGLLAEMRQRLKERYPVYPRDLLRTP